MENTPCKQTIIFVEKRKTRAERFVTAMNVTNAFLVGLVLVAAVKFFKNAKIEIKDIDLNEGE